MDSHTWRAVRSLPLPVGYSLFCIGFAVAIGPLRSSKSPPNWVTGLVPDDTGLSSLSANNKPKAQSGCKPTRPLPSKTRRKGVLQSVKEARHFSNDGQTKSTEKVECSRMVSDDLPKLHEGTRNLPLAPDLKIHGNSGAPTGRYTFWDRLE